MIPNRARLFVIPCLLILTATAAIPITAQDETADLPQSFVSADGIFAFNAPDEWLINEQEAGGVITLDGEGFFTGLISAFPVEGVSVLYPEEFSLEIYAKDFAILIFEDSGGLFAFDDPVHSMLGDNPTIEMVDDNDPNVVARMWIIDLDEGYALITIISNASDPQAESAATTIRDMIATMTYNG